jgi:TPR repeat protein
MTECERGRATSCYSAAIEMQGVDPKQLPAVQALFLRACSLGNSSACTNAAAGRKTLDACSVRTFDQTCAQTGDPWGCAMLGMALARGEGIARDLERARTVLRKACAQATDDPACAAATQLLGQIEAGN